MMIFLYLIYTIKNQLITLYYLSIIYFIISKNYYFNHHISCLKISTTNHSTLDNIEINSLTKFNTSDNNFVLGFINKTTDKVLNQNDYIKVNFDIVPNKNTNYLVLEVNINSKKSSQKSLKLLINMLNTESYITTDSYLPINKVNQPISLNDNTPTPQLLTNINFSLTSKNINSEIFDFLNDFPHKVDGTSISFNQ